MFPARRVLDPFVGSGTTAVESLRRGIGFAGRDVSNVAVEIAWVRTRVLPPGACRRLERTGGRLAGLAMAQLGSPFDLPSWAIPEREWYAPHTLRELCLLKGSVDREDDASTRRILACVLSSVVVKFSRQASDGDPRRNPDFRVPPPGALLRAFRDRCAELAGMLLELGSDLRRRGVTPLEPDLRVADSRRDTVPPSSVDLVLTSPPYAGTYDYARQQARRYPIFGGGGEFADKHEIGSRRREGTGYLRDMEAWLAAAARALIPGGRMLMLLGDGTISGRRVRADRLAAELAGGAGLRFVASASQRRRDWSGGPPRMEHMILMEKHA